MLAITWLGAGPALGQLSSEDIVALRERGKAEGWTFSVGENGATKYSPDQLCGSVLPPDWRSGLPWDPCKAKRDLPASFDWRDDPSGGCTTVKHQGGCGSCWAFAALGTLESAILISEGTTVDLSEQWLISCTDAGDCSGGSYTLAYNYLICRGSQDSCTQYGPVIEADFPYQSYWWQDSSDDVPCNCPHPRQPQYRIDSRVAVGEDIPTASQIKQAIYDHGPVAVTVHANSAFQGYTGGVFNDCEDQPVNHGVVLIGWDDNQGTEGAWILRNSWGTDWGDDGYMLIEYGCSRVGEGAMYVDWRGPDCNGNASPDQCDIVDGSSEDCNENYIPDECDRDDCDGSPWCDDRNENGTIDWCDIDSGTSADCDGNYVPDECGSPTDGYHAPHLVEREGMQYDPDNPPMGDWNEVGDHGIGLSPEWTEDGSVFYSFTLPHPPTETGFETYVREESLVIGIEFREWGAWGFAGPKFSIWDFVSDSWQTICDGCGDHDELVWHLYTRSDSNRYISDEGEVRLWVYCGLWGYTVVDDVSVEYEAADEEICPFEYYSTYLYGLDDCCGDGQADGVGVPLYANIGSPGDGSTVEVLAEARLIPLGGGLDDAVDTDTASWTVSDCCSQPEPAWVILRAPCGSVNGTYTVHIDLMDAAGNVEDQKDLDVTLYPDCGSAGHPSASSPQVSPSSGPWDTALDYSIYVDDPEGDSVDVVLEVYDPSFGGWENQGTRTVSGSGTATWDNRTPFESDDAGLSGQYRFSYDDHEGHVGTWGPYGGPSLAGSEPDTEITSGPSGPIAYDDVTFTWTGYDDVTPTEDLDYSYILEGYGGSWSSWAPSTTVDYTDLPHGEYTFRVTARDTDLNEDPTPDSRTFVVGVAPGEIVPWPMFAYDLHRTSAIDLSTGTGRITEPRERWWKSLDPWEAYRSNYVIADVDADGYAEIVAFGEDPHSTVAPRLFVLDGVTGEIEWYYDCAVERICVENVDGDPQLEIFAAGDGLYCLEWDGNTGTQHWHWPSAQTIYACPTVSDVDYDDTMEVLVANGDLVCLNAQTGAQEWSYWEHGHPEAWISSATPAIANWNRQIYVRDIGSFMGVHCLGAITGSPTLYWSYPTNCSVAGISLGDVDNDSAFEVLVLDECGYLYCLDGDHLEWQINTGDGVLGNRQVPAVANLDDDPYLEIVVAGQSNFHCYDGGSLGTEEWTYPHNGGNEASPPVIADIDGDGQHEVICASWSRLYCLDGMDGSLKWSMDFDTEGGYLGRSPMAVSDPDNDGELELVVGGADIFMIDGPILVYPDGTGDYATIQIAIDAASDGEVVWLADGTFTGDGNRDLDFNGKAITVRSEGGNPNLCIIDCQGNASEPHRGFYFHSGEGEDSVLQGLTIKNGYGSSAGGWAVAGALRCTGASPTVTNCLFSENSAFMGGAVYCTSGALPTFTGCAFAANSGGGGALAASGAPSDSPIIFTDCVFSENTNSSGSLYGAVYLTEGYSAIWTNCVFAGNSSPSGAAIFVDGGFSYSRATECIFVGNVGYHETAYASVVCLRDSSCHLTLEHCTLCDNSVPAHGSTIFLFNQYGATLTGTIMAFNGEGCAINAVASDNVALTCCDLYANAGGDWVGPIADQLGIDGNISADPLFCDTTYGDFHLREPSPCSPGQQPGCDGPIGAYGVACILDCNENDTDDFYDIINSTSTDCNTNGIPDECEIDENSTAPGGPFFCTADCDPDCNTSGIPDECDIVDGTSDDCNSNGIPDECDIADGTSQDSNGDGIPDECQIPLICQSPPTLVNSCRKGQDALSQTFEVWNCGAVTLSYTITIEDDWPEDDWLLPVEPPDGTSDGEHNTHTVHYDTAELEPGEYSGMITIVSPEAGNSPQTIPVILTITHVGEAEWKQRDTPGPSPRSSHAMCFDNLREVAVLFGGNSSGTLGDTWEWDRSTWTQAHAGDPAGIEAPSPRRGHAMAYDSARGVTVLFGGYNGAYLGGTWEWDGSTWTQVHAGDAAGIESPFPRYLHAMAYDSARGVTVLFGGTRYSGGDHFYNDTWEWDGSTWTQVHAGDPDGIESPSPRYRHAVAYDGSRAKTVLFGGGYYDGTSSIYGDTWEWDGNAWTQMDPGDPTGMEAPRPRINLALAYCSTGSVMMLFGGQDPGKLGDTWEWDGSDWLVQDTDMSPSARNGHAMVCDSVGGLVILFGGDDDQGDDEETWEYGEDCNENGIADEFDITHGTSEDLNGNGVPDECEIPGDLDADGDVDVDDYAVFAGCMTGPGAGIDAGCEATDLDGDGDVDLLDYAAFSVAFSLALAEPPWWDSAWRYRKEIIIDHTQVDDDLTEFPVLVSHTSTEFDGHTQANGDDFVFTDNLGSQLSHELELYENGTGELLAWVNVPFLCSSVDTTVYMYYGNANCDPQEDVGGTWNVDYVMVQHLNETSGSHLDSTANGNDLTVEHMTGQGAATGVVGRCDEFERDNTDYLTNSGMGTHNAYTAEAWVKFESMVDYEMIFQNIGPATTAYADGHTWTRGDLITAAGTATTGAWYYYTETGDGTQTELFLNAVSQGTGTGSNDYAGITRIGTDGGLNYWLDGLVDEIRVSKVTRSDAYITTSYSTMSDPASFMTIGEESQRMP